MVLYLLQDYFSFCDLLNGMLILSNLYFLKCLSSNKIKSQEIIYKDIRSF